MKKLVRLFQDRRAMSYPLIISLMLAMLILLGAFAEFLRLCMIASGVRDALQESVISVATTNYNEVYDGLREGYSGGYYMSGDSWNACLDYGDIYLQLDRLLGLQSDGNVHIKQQAAGYEYRLSELNLAIRNAPFAPENTDLNFEADVSVKLEIPVSFGGISLPPASMTIRTKAAYMPRF